MDSAGVDDQIAHDFSPYFIVFKDGRVQRMVETDVVPPSLDATEGVYSKDVAISPEVGARLYLPKLQHGSPQPPPKLPILVHCHGGGFCFVSAICGLYHRYLTSLAAEARAIIVSVEYRLAPEHPLPAGYDDSWAALQWVVSHSPSAGGGPEPWLCDHGDFDRVTVAGDSAGGNIAYNVVMRAGREGLGGGARIRGAVLVHPFFSGAEALDSEVTHAALKALGDRMWKLANPTAAGGLDDPRLNPLAGGSEGWELSAFGCSRLLVFVAERDMLRDRGRVFWERLRSSGWEGEAELVETEGEDHVFHLFNPTCDRAKLLMKRFASFLN